MDFGAMVQTWINVLTHPGDAAFQEERLKPQAKIATAIIWVIIAAVIAAIFGGISMAIGGGAGFMQNIMLNQDIPPEMRQQFAQYAAMGSGTVFGAVFGTLIFAPLAFLVGSGILFVVAKMFGGEGSFEEQTYLLATFWAPITIINAVLGVIPFLGACLGFIISIYQLVLATFAIKVSHNLPGGKAAATVLIPIVVVFLCIICAFFFMMLTFGALFSGAMSGNF